MSYVDIPKKNLGRDLKVPVEKNVVEGSMLREIGSGGGGEGGGGRSHEAMLTKRKVTTPLHRDTRCLF